MQEAPFRDWLARRNTDWGTLGTRISTVRRVETAYGDLDEAYATDGLETILSELEYSKTDQRNAEPNPSRIPISGDVYNGLASIRTHLNSYRQFRETSETIAAAVEAVNPAIRSQRDQDDGFADDNGRSFTLEKDLQAALRASITQLEPGLSIVDGGSERNVPSGRIDILARDMQGDLVVIELKSVKAQRNDVAQVLGYMGDLLAEANGRVRGLLIAPDFDQKTEAAARVVPGLKLIRYRFSFTFIDQP